MSITPCTTICLVVTAIIAVSSGEVASCPWGYIYNPHSASCLKISTQKKSWYSARSACQRDGDRLAVFDTLETISWAKHMRKTYQDWIPYLDENMWIGGRKFYGRWQWDGDIKKDIVVADWHKEEPNNHRGPQNCLVLYPNEQNMQWDDGTCSSTAYYVCEKFLESFLMSSLKFYNK